MTAHTRSSFHLRTLCLQFIICLLLATVCLPHRITAKPNRVKHQHHLHPLHQHKGQGQYESLITSASKTNSSTTTASTASHLKVQQTHTSSTNANASVSASARASANTNASALAAVAGPPRQLVKRDTINYLYRMASSSVHRRTPRAAVFLSSCLRTPQCALQPVPTSTKPTDHMKSSVAKMAQSLGTSVPSSGKQVKSVTGPDSIPALPSGVSSKDTSSLLFKSALYNDIDELKFLHNRKFNVDKVDPNGDTALLAASFQGHSKSIDFLIRHGADVHKKNSAGISPLTVLQARHPALVSTVLRLVGTEETQVEERAAALGLTPSAPSADNKALANRATNALAVHVDPPRSLAVYTYVACSTLNEATGPGSKAVGTDEKTVLLQGKLGHNHTSSSSSKSKSNAKATRTRNNEDGDLCPKRIGSYVRQNRLGNGAFGAVWSYKDEKTNEDVVCKFPIMYGGVSDVISAEQQLFEATHGAKTECQNVLKIQLLRKKTGGSKLFLDCYDVGVSTLDEETKTKLKDQAQLSKAYYEGGMKTHDQAGHRFKYNYRDLPTATPYLMMEKGGETNLHTFAIREKLLTNEELPIVLYQALKAIEVLAEGERHYVHHDIKPDNIMIRKEMRKNGQGEEEEFIAVKIVDYGTVTDFDYMNSLPAMSRPRVVTTLHYAAPEYDLENDFSGHPWSFDTHSLGASIMQLIYAQMPKLKIEVRDSDILDSYWEPKVPDLKSYILDTALDPAYLNGYGPQLAPILFNMVASNPNARKRPSEILKDPFFAEHVPERYRAEGAYDRQTPAAVFSMEKMEEGEEKEE